MKIAMKPLILLSGGADSAAAAVILRARGPIAALFVDYGQPSLRWEQAASQQWARHLGADPWISQRLDLLGLDAMRAPAGEPGARIVPARNLAMLGLAANVALSTGCDGIAIGCAAADHAGYDDCRPAWLQSMRVALAPLGLALHTPVLDMDRAQVRSVIAGGPAAWSCYRPVDGAPCGRCNSCRQDAPG